MWNTYSFVLVSVLVLCTSCLSAQIPAIQQLQDEEKVSFNLHFYPSTLRMVNVQNDTAFNKLIKEIKKLSFYQIDTDSFDVEEMAQLSKQLVAEEAYEEYMTMDGQEMLLQVMGKASGDEWVAMGSMEEQLYLIAVQGKVNWLQVPKVIEAISTTDSTATSTGFEILGNYLKEQQASTKRRKERRQQRAASDKEATEAKEKEANLPE